MIIKAHHKHYMKFKSHMKTPILMLGNQAIDPGYKHPFPKYHTLDPDGGDWRDDLSSLDPEAFIKFETIINIGTVEHVWDVHGALSNVLAMLLPYGSYLSVSPSKGFEGHGIHITDPEYLKKFFTLNGCRIQREWTCNWPGPTDELFWFIAKRKGTLDTITKPQQVFKDGRKI